MSKTQKIWLWISGAMFLIPEILWSPVLNFYYEFIQSGKTGNVQPLRNNFLQISDNLVYLKFIITIEFIGLLILLISLLKNKFESEKLIKYLFVTLLCILLIMVGFALYFAITFNINIF